LLREESQASQSGNLPWIDASWLFDALTGVAVKFLGLRGLPILAMMFASVTTIAVLVLARGARRGLWSGSVLTAIALYFLAGLPLRPSLVSAVFFTKLLKVLLDAPSTAKQRSLYFLPPLFVPISGLDAASCSDHRSCHSRCVSCRTSYCGPRRPDATVSNDFPVRAANSIRQHDLPKPLFNSYDWGGFLTWYLPEYPVAIDNRADAYGEDRMLAYFKLTTGQVPLPEDPSLAVRV
jgi:hypothetical protein